MCAADLIANVQLWPWFKSPNSQVRLVVRGNDSPLKFFFLCKKKTNTKTELLSQDLFLLLLFVQAEFHPLERVVDVDEVPVADYTDHATALRPVAADERKADAVRSAGGGNESAAVSLDDRKLEAMAFLRPDEEEDATTSSTFDDDRETQLKLQAEMEESIAESGTERRRGASAPL